MRYAEVDSIFNVFPESQTTLTRQLLSLKSTNQQTGVAGSDHIRYQMVFNEKIDVYHRYPDQLFSTLAKVGGLLGLLKLVSFFLSVYH